MENVSAHRGIFYWDAKKREASREGWGTDASGSSATRHLCFASTSHSWKLDPQLREAAYRTLDPRRSGVVRESRPTKLELIESRHILFVSLHQKNPSHSMRCSSLRIPSACLRNGVRCKSLHQPRILMRCCLGRNGESSHALRTHRVKLFEFSRGRRTENSTEF